MVRGIIPSTNSCRYGFGTYPFVSFSGSARGGWTQFLIQDLKCVKGYRCDPGELCPKVKQLDGVHYLQMKSDKAMSCVQKEIEMSKEWIQ